jgi:predicted outer membrane lipoprotein
VINVVNLSTPLGLAIGKAGRAHLSRGPRGVVLATSFRLPLRAGALTVGDVVITRKTREQLLGRPALVRHELRHTAQYAWCLGLPLLPAYGIAAAWSWLRTGDPASRNVFERRAGLSDGGYRERPVRPLAGRRRQGW